MSIFHKYFSFCTKELTVCILLLCFSQRENAKEAKSERVYVSLEFDNKEMQNLIGSDESIRIVQCPLPPRGSSVLGIKEKSLCISLSVSHFVLQVGRGRIGMIRGPTVQKLKFV